MAATYFGLLTEKLEVSGDAELMAALQAGRLRAAQAGLELPPEEPAAEPEPAPAPARRAPKAKKPSETDKDT